MPNPTYGHILEGTLEQDPLTDAFSIRTIDAEGKPLSVDIQPLLESYAGRDLRLTLITFDSLQELAQMVEAGGAVVEAVYPEDVPVPFQIHRKS